MTAGRHGLAEVFLFVDGYDLRAAKVNAFRHKVIAPNVESHGIGDSWKERSPTGVRDVEIVQEGAFFDTSAGNSHAALSLSVPSSVQAPKRIVSFGYAGLATGDPFSGVEGTYSHEYAVIAENENLQKANAAYMVSGRLDDGAILQPLEARIADWDTESTPVDYTLDTGQRVVPIVSSSVANPSIITTASRHGLTNGQSILIAGHTGSAPSINGEHVATVISPTTFSIPVNVTGGGTGGTLVQANSLNGGAGHLQVTAFSGFSGFIGTIRDSPDDIVYSDLVVFDDVTAAPAAQRKTVAGTIDRYLAFKGDVTGSGSITVFCGFARS